MPWGFIFSQMASWPSWPVIPGIWISSKITSGKCPWFARFFSSLVSRVTCEVWWKCRSWKFPERTQDFRIKGRNACLKYMKLKHSQGCNADVRCFFHFKKKNTKEIRKHCETCGFTPFLNMTAGLWAIQVHWVHPYNTPIRSPPPRQIWWFPWKLLSETKKTKEQYESVNVMLPILAVGNGISPVQWKMKSYSAIQKETMVLKARFPLNHYRRKKSTASLKDVYMWSVVLRLRISGHSGLNAALCNWHALKESGQHFCAIHQINRNIHTISYDRHGHHKKNHSFQLPSTNHQYDMYEYQIVNISW